MDDGQQATTARPVPSLFPLFPEPPLVQTPRQSAFPIPRQPACKQERVHSQPHQPNDAGDANEPVLEQLMLLEQQKKKLLLGSEAVRSANLIDYQMQLILLEQQDKKRHLESEAVRSANLRDYQMQLMLLEQQDKKRRLESEAVRSANLRDYQMQLMLLKQQDKKRRLESEAVRSANLRDYQMQLTLLKQQDKKRRLESEPVHSGNLPDHQMQLMLLEQQNETHLPWARRHYPVLENSWAESASKELVGPSSAAQGEQTGDEVDRLSTIEPRSDLSSPPDAATGLPQAKTQELY
ncbi:hypothetical protein QQS21_009733 [Conoideocrella luteorostrata]|uniref:Uncharacterized protein n=1 Tax=Conoideocrella luteorostrata TaxID=1105319 RepID=A0AAJ0CGC0_9HYPO|nr:hypothetical protein QQS21_009733 [Conoideocrella luteorostrata]